VNSLRRRGKLAKLSRRTRWTLSAGMSLLLVAVFAPITAASGQQAGARKLAPRAVKTSSDQGRRKLGRDLLQMVDRHANGSVPVFVSVVGDPRGVARRLDRSHTTRSGDVSLVVGRIPAQQLVKLASDAKVVSVRSVTFRMDGTPVDFKEHRRAPERDRQGQGGRVHAGRRRAVLRRAAAARLPVRAVQEAERARRQDPQLHRGLAGRLRR
jgi:hypothetical protein